MIATARQKNPPFDAILVWKLSRFARNREDSIIYKSLLRKLGILVISINEPSAHTSGESRQRLELLRAQLAEVDARLAKLYEALETGEFNGGQLAPRIKTFARRKKTSCWLVRRPKKPCDANGWNLLILPQSEDMWRISKGCWQNQN